MTNDWILDVLADLRAFAGKNNLTSLVTELDGVIEVAKVELGVGDGIVTGDTRRNASLAGAHYREHAAR